MGPEALQTLPPCAVCSGPGQARCSRCTTVTYCGPECQRLDWQQHKAACCARSLRPQESLSDGPAAFDVHLTPQRSVDTAQRVVECLQRRGVCVIRAGADRAFQRALAIEARLLWDSGEFGEAQKGQPEVPGGEVGYEARQDRVVWLSAAWTRQHDRRCKALKVLDSQLSEFGQGLKALLEEQLGLALRQRSCGMLACYAGDEAPGVGYGFHVDNPYLTCMATPDDGRRLTLVYFLNQAWEPRNGGALQVCLSDPRRPPSTASEALQHPRLTVAPEADTLVAFFSHTMFHAVLPVVDRKRFALSTWFQST